MGIIKKLSKSVVEKIAAGEVVERPASVAKELVENAIDAGARNIKIDISGGGKGRLVIIDDGVGMNAEDLQNCVLRHATSKISNEDDLWSVATMGFRGEALAAIAAVSKMTIESKPNLEDVIEGACVEIDGGVVKKSFPAGCPGGTKVVVSDIFFNVPARKKFLKSDNVEYGHIVDTVTSLALANPDVRFELSSGNKKSINIPAATDSLDSIMGRIVSVIGDGYRGKFISVEEKTNEISIRGFVAEAGRAAGKDVHVFLNNRVVRDRVIMHALSTALSDGTERNRYPAAVLWIDIDPTKIDVNVHPTKREVRFSNSGAVHDFVRNAVKKAFHAKGISQYVPNQTRCDVESIKDFLSYVPQPTSFLESSKTAKEQFNLASLVTTKLRPLGQLGLTYVLCEDEDGTLVLIDQHAAHERLGFDELKNQYVRNGVAGQRLLIPENVELGAKELEYINENLEVLTKAGFEIEPFGGNTVVVKTVPEMLSGVSLSKIFAELADELEQIGTSHSVDETIDKIFAVIACHRQVRRGDRLSQAELINFVRDIEKENITHCPHGRPAIVRIDQSEIEKLFNRRS